MGWARGFVLFHVLLMVLGLMLIQRLFLSDTLSSWYIGGAVILPLLLSAGLSLNARTRKEHVTAGRMMKFAMVTAVAYAFLLPYVIQAT
jgi:1,4-dihydroxy-2-naphthoate octaprenyltransferase